MNSVRTLLGLSIAVTTSIPALAQNFPAKPVRMVVASAPGGGIDGTARMLSKVLKDVTGQGFVVENRAGAGGIVGSEAVVKSRPDGYTLLMASSSHVVNPTLYEKLPYDSVKDFTAVSLVARSPNILVVNPSVPARSVKELIALAKAKPGSMNFSSSGNGQASHLAGERFKLMADVNMTHVAYKGTGPAVIGLVGGEVQVQFATLPSVLEQIKAGRLRALGIAQPKRSAVLPDVPTIAEAGVPGFEAGAWYGVMGPAGLPRDVVQTLYHAITQSLETAELKDLLQREGSEPVGSRPEEFSAYVSSEIPKWAMVVKNANLKAE